VHAHLAAPIGAIENSGVRAFLACLRRDVFSTIRDRLAHGVADGDLTASPGSLDAIASHHTTVVQALSVQARDGAGRADLQALITCAMIAWDTHRCRKGIDLTRRRPSAGMSVPLRDEPLLERRLSGEISFSLAKCCVKVPIRPATTLNAEPMIDDRLRRGVDVSWTLMDGAAGDGGLPPQYHCGTAS